MKAVTFQGFKKVKVKNVDEPKLIHDDDLIVKVEKSSICGSDLHLYRGMLPSLSHDYIIGHEALGTIVATGKAVTRVRKGDKVIIPFNVACGECMYCKTNLESLCNNANPNGETGACFGYSRMFGDYDGCQAELVRVPFGNYMPFIIPKTCEIPDQNLLMLADAIPTAFWGVEDAQVKPGDTVIVLGSGPIGLLTQKFAWSKGANRVIAVDCVPYRLEHAKRTNHVDVYNFKEIEEVGSLLLEETKGGADVVIDCVGFDGKMTWTEVAQTLLMTQAGTFSAIRTATQAVRKGGTIQLVGIYGIRYNQFPLGDLFSRNITLKMGIAPVVHTIPYLYQQLQNNSIDPTDIISHEHPLTHAKEAYHMFDQKEDSCLKVVLNHN